MKKSIFQELVEESIVLLKNEEQILPLKEKKVAFLGRAQIETIFSETVREHPNPLQTRISYVNVKKEESVQKQG